MARKPGRGGYKGDFILELLPGKMDQPESGLFARRRQIGRIHLDCQQETHEQTGDHSAHLARLNDTRTGINGVTP